MTLNNSQKALAITLLITGTLVLSVLNIGAYKRNTAVAETLYQVEVIEEVIPEETEDITLINNTKSTNKAYNTSENYKHFSKAYKPIAPPEDYTNPKLETYKNRPKSDASSEKNDGNSARAEQNLTSFNSVNEVLNKQSKNRSAKQSNVANTNSSVYFSLKGRTDVSLPIPVYLCNAEGKIVINIIVDKNGNVIDTYVNNASTSSNLCLQEHALQYAKEAKFNTSNKVKQIGSITFEFKGK